METILLVLAIGITNLMAFLIGARTGQKVVNKEPVELPNMNPVAIYKDHKEKADISKEQEKLNTMLENINNYDGTTTGQKDI